MDMMAGLRVFLCSAAGKRLASASFDGTARLSDAETGELLQFENHWNEDTKQLLSLLGDEDVTSEGDEEEICNSGNLSLESKAVRYGTAGEGSLLETL